MPRSKPSFRSEESFSTTASSSASRLPACFPTSFCTPQASMDFLPLPDGVPSHVPVPDLGGAEYDNEGFFGYDQRQGWNSEALRRGALLASRSDWHDYVTAKIESISLNDIPEDASGLMQAVVSPFIQTWILFGILQEALRRPVFRDEVSFTTTCVDVHGNTVVVRRIRLKSLFQEFMSKEDELRADQGRSSHLIRCLREASFILSDLDWLAAFADCPMVPLPLYQSLAVLLETLSQYTFEFCDSLIGVEPPFLTEQRQVQQRLKERHWCPSMIKRVNEQFQAGGLYFASLLLDFVDEHEHDNCTELVCTASNIDQRTYRVRHVPEYCLCRNSNCNHTTLRCSCMHVAMPEKEFRDAFEGDGYPLVRLSGDRLEVVSSSVEVQYIALSHCWFDGRGNPLSNALPLCQLNLISSFVTTLSAGNDVFFWIDTLCVPIQEPLRNTAIVRMAEVYSAASHVLVLAAELLSCPRPSTPAEALFRIFCCRWNTRLWTMQEAALARDINFQFSDDAVRYSELVKARRHRANSVDGSRYIMDSALGALKDVVQMRSSSTSPQSLFDKFWSGLTYRSTSRLLDVAISGSILLGNDVARVLEVSDHEKMKIFWLCQKGVPASVIWVDGPRLAENGFHWAPGDLLDSATATSMLALSPPASPTEDGLLFEGVEALLMANFSMPAYDRHLFRFALPASSQKYVLMKYPGHKGPYNWNEPRNLWRGQWVVLMRKLPSPTAPGEPAALAIPVNNIANEESMGKTSATPIYARYLTKVWIIPEGGVFSQQMAIDGGTSTMEEYISSLKEEEITDITEMRPIPSTQRWCIS